MYIYINTSTRILYDKIVNKAFIYWFECKNVQGDEQKYERDMSVARTILFIPCARH